MRRIQTLDGIAVDWRELANALIGRVVIGPGSGFISKCAGLESDSTEALI
jgi:hypothetical protein